MMRFAMTALICAAATFGVGAALAHAAGAADFGWAAVGWTAALMIGVAGGSWLIRKHGRPGPGFVAGMGIATAARFAVVGAGLILALRHGGQAPWMFLSGFAAGFVPVTVVEVIALRRASRSSPGPGARQGA